MSKPFLVTVSDSRSYTPSLFSIDLATPKQAATPAKILIPTDDLLARFKNVTPNDSTFKATSADYLALLRDRYKKHQIQFDELVKHPMLIVHIGCEPGAMTWEWVSIYNVLIPIAARAGRDARFIGAAQPTRIPQLQLA